MRTQLNSETENWPKADGGLPSDEALFTDALLASYRRAIESVAAARGDIGAAALRLAAIWRAGGGWSTWAQARPALRRRRTQPNFPAPSASTKAASRSFLAGGTAEPFRIYRGRGGRRRGR